MTKLLVLRGVPASGKTSFSVAWVAEDPDHRARVNRDDLRFSMFGKYSGLSFEQESLITDVEHLAVQKLIAHEKSVVIDAMGLRPKYVREWMKFADRNKVELEFVEFPISLEEAIERDSARQKSVGEDVLRNIWNKYTKKGKFLPVEYTPAPDLSDSVEYVPDRSKPLALIVDIDGTVSHNAGHRGWYEYDKVDQDTPKINIIRIVRAMHLAGYKIIFVSGRSDDCYDMTKAWLQRHVLPYDADSFPLFMRKTGDTRKDSIVKSEIFDEHLRYNYHIVGSLDDRNQVVAFWRSLGLDCLQVQLGEY